jgi:hypothetical protein
MRLVARMIWNRRYEKRRLSRRGKEGRTSNGDAADETPHTGSFGYVR